MKVVLIAANSALTYSEQLNFGCVSLTLKQSWFGLFLMAPHEA